jgi:S1-C subfamily serine protease
MGWLNSKMTPPNYEKMIEYYEKAALMGEPSGISNLAFSYLNGNGVVKNYAEALAFFYLAQAVGNNKNKKVINALETSLPPNSIQVAQNKAQAIHEQIKKNKKIAINKEEKSQDKDKNKEMPEQAGASGSGVFVSSKGIIVTAFHVIENGNKILVRTSKGDYPAKVVSGDRKNDLALLQLEGMNTPLKVAPIAGSSSVKLGETVFTLGFPNIGVQGFNLKMTKGEISSTTGIQDDPRQFQISVPVQPGNSGGPLFDSKGNVVGIVVAKLNATMMVEHTGDLPQNVNYAVKSAYLLPLLEEYRSEMPSSKDESDSEKMEEVVSEVRDACVMILVE